MSLEGPLAVTDCSAGHAQCEIERHLPASVSAWQRVNLAIRRSLYDR
jgi:DNA-binding IscR family transcriptional regulator